MPHDGATVGDMLDTITSLAELNAFADMLRSPPEGVRVKTATEADWARIADMKIRFQKGGAA